MAERIPENFGNTIMFEDKEARLDNMEDKEVIERFVASLCHPGAGATSEQRADSVLCYAGIKRVDGLTDLRQKWRERIRTIESQTAALSDKMYDDLIDPRHESYDEGFASLIESILEIHDNDELDIQRRALRALSDLRIASLRVGAYDSRPWCVLAEQLRKE